MKKVALHNLGCKVNAYEMEVMQQMLEENGCSAGLVSIIFSYSFVWLISMTVSSFNPSK